MKKQLLALSLGCAMLASSIIPSAFAAEGDATIHIFGDTTAAGMTAHGAYASGIYFNTVAGYDVSDFSSQSTIDTAALLSKTSSANTTNGGTDVNLSTDYFEISSANNNMAPWTVAVVGAEAGFTNGTNNATYAFTDDNLTADQSSLSTGDVQLYAKSTNASYEFTDKVGVGCTMTTASVTFNNVKVTGIAADIASFDPTVADSSNKTEAQKCVSYKTHILMPLRLVPHADGFTSTDTPTSTVTFSL